ncbi:MAG: hypothetical protein NXI32_20575 [bacterium]|nr:hypothetical protein [bacterium]
MVPINPATQSGIYPSTSGSGFDPYASTTTTAPMIGGPVSSVPPTAVYGNPAYPNQPYGAPALPPPSMTGPGYGYTNPFGAPPSLPPTMPAPTGAPPTAYGQPGVYPSPYANPYAGPASPYGTPNVLFPQASTSTADWYNNLGTQSMVYGAPPTSSDIIKFNQGPRFRWSYIFGDDAPDALAINDMDVSMAFVYPSCCTGQPIYFLPAFSLHLWSGPKPPSTGDLPPSAYSAFLDTGWQSNPADIWGAELGLRVGVFTDFDTLTSDSLRVMGRAIGRVGLTPRLTGKLGVIYLDRNSIKMLPAGGLLWQPNPNTRIDFFFPEPKLTSYLTTAGDKDMWWYVGGFYGGGSWTIRRANSALDSIDINDIRLVLGLEFGRNEAIRLGRRNAFVEIGYVFDRELLYRNSPQDNLDLQDTIMLRAGFGY